SIGLIHSKILFYDTYEIKEHRPIFGPMYRLVINDYQPDLISSFYCNLMQTQSRNTAVIAFKIIRKSPSYLSKCDLTA
ncbi:hypothetical protein KEL62_06270, partial [Enterococcus faecium]|nr:hypothetical protein [Enterococcus faecium]